MYSPCIDYLVFSELVKSECLLAHESFSTLASVPTSFNVFDKILVLRYRVCFRRNKLTCFLFSISFEYSLKLLIVDSGELCLQNGVEYFGNSRQLEGQLPVASHMRALSQWAARFHRFPRFTSKNVQTVPPTPDHGGMLVWPSSGTISGVCITRYFQSSKFQAGFSPTWKAHLSCWDRLSQLPSLWLNTQTSKAESNALSTMFLKKRDLLLKLMFREGHTPA